MGKRFGLLAGIAAVFLGACIVLVVTGINCPIRWLTGIPCPGCGMTRACLGLLFGDPSAGGSGIIEHIQYAMRFHPLVLIVPPVLLYILLGKHPLLGSPKREIALLAGVCGLMIAVYIVRLLAHDPVLSIDWNSGMIARIIHALTA